MAMKMDCNHKFWSFSDTIRQETIFQFTKDNSPLPSNAVNDIASDEATGGIF
jgi:hypothetical protein